MVRATEILEAAFNTAEAAVVILSPVQMERVSIIVEHAETQKAVLAVLLTSLTRKVETPAQDVRQHKIELPGGYSGRVYDTNFVTPFIRKKFPRLAMKSGSGWLTRSLEQAHAFTLNFPGRISNSEVKTAFLEILHDVEQNGANPQLYLAAIFHQLIQSQSQNSRVFEKQLETFFTVRTVLETLQRHFYARYHVAGASRLPVLAIYSIYELLVDSNRRYSDKQLQLLKSHTTSDTKSRTIGDIEVTRSDGTYFEAVEVKHEIAITPALVEDVFEKIARHPIARYYLLTTADPNAVQVDEINQLIDSFRAQHGCEVIVNGVMPSLKYYLRLMDEPALLLQSYERNLLADYTTNTDVKNIHIEVWRSLTEELRR